MCQDAAGWWWWWWWFTNKALCRTGPGKYLTRQHDDSCTVCVPTRLLQGRIVAVGRREGGRGGGRDGVGVVWVKLSVVQWDQLVL